MSPTGHLAIGFAVKKWDTKVPVIWFLVGAYTIDIVYLILTSLGVETFGNSPWSHSLLMAVVYALIGGAITWIIVRHDMSAILMSIVILSHWVLDFIVWDNLTLAFNKTPLVGLGLYNRIGFDLNTLTLNTGMFIATVLESILLIIGIYLYMSSKKKRM